MKFTNSLTPDTENVLETLEQYAQKTKEGKWRLKADIKQRESEHDAMVQKIAFLGKKAGFKVHADLPEWRTQIELNIPPENLERIKQIDVIWYDKNEITHEFEVENSTGITEAVVRGSNIQNQRTKRYIVIPEERQEFFYKKITEPMLQEKINEFGWLFIFYNTLNAFYDENEKATAINITSFEKLAGVPKAKVVEQKGIQDFLVTNKA